MADSSDLVNRNPQFKHQYNTRLGVVLVQHLFGMYSIDDIFTKELSAFSIKFKKPDPSETYHSPELKLCTVTELLL